MIGHIKGEVLFSDGNETIILTNSGIGYQVFFNKVLPEGSEASLFISHVVREAFEALYGFESLRAKKLFELLMTVKGVGPKSAFSLISSLGTDQLIDAIAFDNKKAITQAPGIGNKGAAQILLDLSGKINKARMYKVKGNASFAPVSAVAARAEPQSHQHEIINETLMACKELGFKEERIMSLAKKILAEHTIARSEQLVHLVLKEV